MLQVTVYSVDENANDLELGTLRLQGDSIRASTPTVEKLLKQPLYLGRETIYPEDAERFLQNLHRQYRNPYLRVSEAEDDLRDDQPTHHSVKPSPFQRKALEPEKEVPPPIDLPTPKKQETEPPSFKPEPPVQNVQPRVKPSLFRKTRTQAEPPQQETPPSKPIKTPTESPQKEESKEKQSSPAGSKKYEELKPEVREKLDQYIDEVLDKQLKNWIDEGIKTGGAVDLEKLLHEYASSKGEDGNELLEDLAYLMREHGLDYNNEEELVLEMIDRAVKRVDLSLYPQEVFNEKKEYEELNPKERQEIDSYTDRVLQDWLEAQVQKAKKSGIVPNLAEFLQKELITPKGWGSFRDIIGDKIEQQGYVRHDQLVETILTNALQRLNLAHYQAEATKPHVDTLGRIWRDGKPTQEIEPLELPEDEYSKAAKYNPKRKIDVEKWLGTQLQTSRGLPKELGDPVTQTDIDNWVNFFTSLPVLERQRLFQELGIPLTVKPNGRAFGEFLEQVADNHHNPEHVAVKLRKLPDLHQFVDDLYTVGRVSEAERKEQQRLYDDLNKKAMKTYGLPITELRYLLNQADANPALYGKRKLENMKKLQGQLDQWMENSHRAKRLARENKAYEVSKRLKAKVTNGTQIDIANRGNVDPDAFDRILQAADLLEETFAWPNGPSLYFATYKDGKDERAHYRSSTGEINWQGGEDKTSILTAIHEIAHGIEHNDPGILAAVLEFRKYRVKDEPPTNLQQKYGNSYESYEEGYKDQFDLAFGDERSGYYTGKIYDGGRATEILSMGVELLFKDPLGFAARDPEYCAFIVGILQGTLRKKPIPQE